MDKNAAKKKFQFPDTWIVVFCIVAIIALLSWIIPSGTYDYEQIDVNGTTRSVAIAGTYRAIDKAEASPTGFLGLFAALYEGMVSAADIIFVMMVCAATFGVLVKTGAFHAGIGKIMKKLGNKDIVLIPVLMVLFALGGSIFGMLSEFYGFYPLIVGLFIALGYDAMVGFAVIALGEYVGFMASTLNPYTVAVAQSIAGVELYSGLGFRWICFVVFMGIAIAYTVVYAIRVRKKPEISAQLMLLAHTLINFLIPSGSGQAAATMPIMAPLADNLGLTRQVACLAFQFGDGLSNLFWPTAGIVTICGLGDVKYDKWMKWFWKLFLLIVLLSGGTA